MGLTSLGKPLRSVVFMPGMTAGGGAERYAASIAVALRDIGHEVILATSGTNDPEWVNEHFGLDMSSIKLVGVPSVPRWADRLPQSLWDIVEDWGWARTVRRLKPDGFFNCLYRSELPGQGSVLNVYICHFPHDRRVKYSPWGRRLYMWGVAGARRLLLAHGRAFLGTYDVVCANSKFTAGHLQRRWRVTPEVLYPPCGDMLVAEVPKQQRILVVGRFEPPVDGVPNKRIDALVGAFAGMSDLHQSGWELHVAGACSDRNADYLQSLRHASGGAPVVFHPNVTHEELARLYSSARLYWHAQGFGESAESRPETQEHFGITTVEAMSAGAIPVVIDTAGPREVVAPVTGARRWHTLGELGDATRELAALSTDELEAIAVECQERASDFAPRAFQQRLTRLLKSVPEAASSASQ